MNSVSLLLRGGLGNNLFQIASTYTYAKNNQMDFFVFDGDIYGNHFPTTRYKNNIFKKVKFTNERKFNNVHHAPFFEFLEIPKFDTSIGIEGYFQSEKFFKDNRKEILDLFEIPEEISQKLKEEYPSIFEKENICSIHVRRGDYVYLENYYTNLSNTDYYRNAVNLFDNNYNFVIFSDAIEWCKSQFDFIPNKVFVDSLMDYEEIYLMSLCKNNIIANSSFSWWGAWLNKNENKKIISPKKWFNHMYHSYNTGDLIPTNWLVIE